MIGAAHPVRIRIQSPGASQPALALLVTAMALLVPTLVTIREAGALLDPFAMSPTGGPPATVVHVGGTGCAPGIAVSPTQDYVNITSTALSLSTNLPVAANGSWSGSITVPATAPAVPGVVVATCFTNGLPSLTASYAPKTFTVTSAPAAAGGTTPTTAPSPTTAPTPPATNPVATPTTLSSATPPGPSTGGSTPSDNGGGHPGPATSAGFAGAGGTGAARANNGSGTSPGGAAGRTPTRTGAISPSRPNLAETASAAGLPDPSLARASRNDGGNSLWLLWLALLALVAAASALLCWWRRAPVDSQPAREAL